MHGCDFIVIGAGAAGLVAAITAGKAGKSVVLIDHMAAPARKLLITGGGKCNFSNKNVRWDRYASENPHFCKSALSRLTTNDILDVLKQNKIAHTEKNDGKLFLNAASVLRDFLFREIKNASVDCLFGAPVASIGRTENLFVVETVKKTVAAPCLLIATGGLSFPKTGATDFAVRVAKQFGVNVVPTAPALTPIRLPPALPVDFSGLQGVGLPVRMTTGKKSVRGDLLFTHNGISGPAALQTSLYWRENALVVIDFLPDTDLESLLKDEKRQNGVKKTETFLTMPKRLADRFTALLPENKRAVRPAELSGGDIAALSRAVNRFSFVPAGLDGYNKAEVTRGGVDTAALSSKTMECRACPGLFFAGECVDVTGEIGGFNLHWAFASGKAAGVAVCGM